MPTSKSLSNRIIIIVMTIIGAFICLGLYGAYTGIRNFQDSSARRSAERSTKLQGFMPATPAHFKLIDEGFDPKAYCLDKCGFEYRTYSYPAEETVCTDITTALQKDERKLTLERESDPEQSCSARLVKVRDNDPKYQFFNLRIKQTDALGQPTEMSTYLSLTLYPGIQQVRYMVGEELYLKEKQLTK